MNNNKQGKLVIGAVLSYPLNNNVDLSIEYNLYNGSDWGGLGINASKNT